MAGKRMMMMETKLANDKTSGKAKLKAGQALTDDEITALFGA